MALDDFEKDSKTVDAVNLNFIIIGEAARNVPEEVVARHPSYCLAYNGRHAKFRVQ